MTERIEGVPRKGGGRGYRGFCPYFTAVLSIGFGLIINRF